MRKIPVVFSFIQQITDADNRFFSVMIHHLNPWFVDEVKGFRHSLVAPLAVHRIFLSVVRSLRRTSVVAH